MFEDQSQPDPGAFYNVLGVVFAIAITIAATMVLILPMRADSMQELGQGPEQSGLVRETALLTR